MQRSGDAPRRLRAHAGAALFAVAAATCVVACGGSGNDHAARETLIQASLRSAAAKNYVAVVGANTPKPITFTYASPDRLRAEQSNGTTDVVFVQLALTGYHSDPKHPGKFQKKLEKALPLENSPLTTVSSLIGRATHVSQHHNQFDITVRYGTVNVKLKLDLDATGHIGDAELPVFDKAKKVGSYKLVSFSRYGTAPPVAAPAAGLVTKG